MASSHRIALELELDLAADPIEGELRGVGGPTRTFVGWLGLVAALEELADDQSPAQRQTR